MFEMEVFHVRWPGQWPFCMLLRSGTAGPIIRLDNDTFRQIEDDYLRYRSSPSLYGVHGNIFSWYHSVKLHNFTTPGGCTITTQQMSCPSPVSDASSSFSAGLAEMAGFTSSSISSFSRRAGSSIGASRTVLSTNSVASGSFLDGPLLGCRASARALALQCSSMCLLLPRGE